MKLGFGLYRHMLNDDSYRFAKQCGATEIIVHLCDYGQKGTADARKVDQPTGDIGGWGLADHPQLWTLEELLEIRRQLEAHGLNFYGVENFDPAQWHDILLDGPQRDAQIEQAKEQIRIFAQAGIQMFGYNFSLSGVTGRATDLETRGGARSVGLAGRTEATDAPLPKGMVWNMVYDPAATGFQEPVEEAALWERLAHFLNELAPVAEACGITLAAHPDDPPLERVRQQPKLVYRHAHYQKLIDLHPSPANQLEFCVGTLAEMQDADLYGCIEQYAAQGRIGYVHLRNVSGQVPHYHETFIDNGDIDVERVLRILKKHNFEGVIIPDHAPQMTCPAPWHAGMAFAMGYLHAKIQSVSENS
jgi:mannonate dehydratase